MSGDREEAFMQLGCLGVLAIFVALAGAVYFWARGGYASGYRNGQIDAIQGNVKYELRDQPDGSRVWTEIETERGK